MRDTYLRKLRELLFDVAFKRGFPVNELEFNAFNKQAAAALSVNTTPRDVFVEAIMTKVDPADGQGGPTAIWVQASIRLLETYCTGQFTTATGRRVAYEQLRENIAGETIDPNELNDWVEKWFEFP